MKTATSIFAALGAVFQPVRAISAGNVSQVESHGPLSKLSQVSKVSANVSHHVSQVSSAASRRRGAWVNARAWKSDGRSKSTTVSPSSSIHTKPVGASPASTLTVRPVTSSGSRTACGAPSDIRADWDHVQVTSADQRPSPPASPTTGASSGHDPSRAGMSLSGSSSGGSCAGGACLQPVTSHAATNIRCKGAPTSRVIPRRGASEPSRRGRQRDVEAWT